MSEETQRQEMWKKRVVYQLPGMEAATVRRDVAYAGDLTMDIYYPPEPQSGTRIPAVIFVAGYPDPGGKFKELGQFISWGELAAASGLAAITYANADPARDLAALLQYLRQNAEALGIDGNRIALWAGSGHVPTALSMVNQVKCAALCYGFMLDLDGSSGVAESAKQFGFANPCAGESVEDLAGDVPLFIARAGQDEFLHLNESIDGFLAKALQCNLPITFVNYPEAPHGFDLKLDSEASREIIRRILAFLQFHLLP